MTTQLLARTAHQTQHDVRALLSSAATGLLPMFDQHANIFCAKFIRGQHGMVQEGVSHRYTLITLMGLYRLEQSGQTSPIAIRPVLQALLHGSALLNISSTKPTSLNSTLSHDVSLDTNLPSNDFPADAGPSAAWIASAGDLGLLLWLCALVSPEQLDDFFASHDLTAALAHFPDARDRRTMELSWILSGLAHAAYSRQDLRDRLAPLAGRLAGILQGNRGVGGAFGHQAATPGLGGGVKGMLRGRLGSFADQVYPIYAFAWAHRAFGFASALDIANACAANICRAQGALGQWWWHYDARSGEAVGRYPVYAVHQHGMAPLALFALADAGGRDFTREIFLGLEWIYGQNELGVDMRDAEANVVWRCIRPTQSRRYLDQALAMLKLQGKSRTPRELHVLQECWPYELGWLLYAFAGRPIE